MKVFNNLGVAIPTILLPRNIDTATWPTIACDQYTQDASYWSSVESLTRDKISTYHITLPEIFLSRPNKSDMIASIKSTMKEYLDSGVFNSFDGLVYTKRTLDDGAVRCGLIIALDLESYDYTPGTSALTRATEKTIKERIPPRVAIRAGAPLETPHIMLLVNDKSNRLFNTLDEIASRAGYNKLYDGPLMLKSGSITGYKISDGDTDRVIDALNDIAKNNTDSRGTFLFAAGDGNHSLATAKTVWDNYKRDHNIIINKDNESTLNNPLRYALVEVTNLYDDALKFHAIHRALFNTAGDRLIDFMKSRFNNIERLDTFKEASSAVNNRPSLIGVAYNKNFFTIDTKEADLVISTIQPLLDEYMANIDSTCKIDYIHDDNALEKLVNDGATGVILPKIDKSALFPTIKKTGVLPRKSFSLGTASQKRFYTECRALF